MVQLNQDFINSIAKDMPAHLTMDDFISYSSKPLRPSIRINTLKISSDEFVTLMAAKGWTLDPIPWCSDGFWVALDNEIQLGNTIEHIQGLFYIQEASSMLPPTALFDGLDNSSEYTILDMASAPGSKTTQMASLMDNKGLLVANEYSSSRVKVLHANVQRMGVYNTALTHFDARVFGEYLYHQFDAILLDAPCSGEGTIRKDPLALRNWSLEENASIIETQKALIESAFLALKTGGSLVYSTCALSRSENQEVCEHLMSCFPQAVEFQSLSELFPDADKSCTSEGFLHVWPQIYDSEGFFIAKVRKVADVERQKPLPKAQRNFPFTAANNKTKDELSHYFKHTFGISLPKDGLIMERDLEYWLFPAKMADFIGKMRFQRIGLKLADGLKKGFKVRHEAIMALSDKHNAIELNESQAIEYLMGRDIPLQDGGKPQGEVILTYHHCALGVAKHLGKRLKNNLPRELVRDKVISAKAKTEL
ncbi:16S rRNA (cytosine(1407)-C(5))-methyltransferase RsmF [Shewanella woodyi]|uniref:Ribosomal RNA small subunit methyltransferase F n=1 Tax=Shewanella woodyi (strain ATCC 51908 / MS32) TaxID=392500 RepID=RSMF_SHEWM|nr:16S rRNA (cytosine(1407)-C(5))-methyltransferase RsmF [Shewanella woodyi]B1KQN1.1 RecName: Full=Ribosomal RNA small subunit methyltransferase F; AltName: Full=16S rRNA m5C1407 methyltransferase; AltName: Full=rRNA (cytosine-C(5)-)-methyltransferase RsmF [Shewanella woodyi ATCC 51908]ACA86270.1 RNA methylase, NOL1/NOP2/sun family [Shewanella woodyi ATCC 51908]